MLRRPDPSDGTVMTYAHEPTRSRGMRAADDENPTARRRGIGCLFELLETLLLTLVIYLVIHNFVAQPFKVEQSSMIPTLLPEEYVLIDKLTPRFGGYQRGDIVVFTPPEGYEQRGVPFIKRVIGTPGDVVTLSNGHVFVTPPGGEPRQIDEPYLPRDGDGAVATTTRDPDGPTEWTVGEGTYFVMGDNRLSSQDSRVFGPIARDLIVGRGWVRYFPIDRVGFFDTPSYAELDGATGLVPWSVFWGSLSRIQASITLP